MKGPQFTYVGAEWRGGRGVHYFTNDKRHARATVHFWQGRWRYYADDVPLRHSLIDDRALLRAIRKAGLQR